MNPHDSLRQLLCEWRDVPAVAPDLAVSVRGDIARRTNSRTERWLMTRIAGLDGHWPRLVAASIAIGVLVGVLGAECVHAREQREIPALYAQLIDPVACPRASHKVP